MNWIVKIEGEENKNKRIRINFKPLNEQIHFFGEYRIKNEWNIFSYKKYDKIQISLEEIQENMEIVLTEMNKRVDEYENLNKGFSVLKWIGIDKNNE